MKKADAGSKSVKVIGVRGELCFFLFYIGKDK